MNDKQQIITWRSLELGADFDDIRKKIKSYSQSHNLNKFFKFDAKEKRMKYRTEGIRPDYSQHPNRCRILFLFSNPHPKSVCNGLFLSEPHSRSFWNRLFESCYLKMLQGKEINLDRWDDTTPVQLGKLMLNGKYESKFLFYFHCLYPIPTNQAHDLKRLFAGEKWKEIQCEAIRELDELLKGNDIKHIVAFTGPIFSLITGTSEKNIKGWREKVKVAADNLLAHGDQNQYWETLSSGCSKATFDNDISVFRCLDTRVKNWGKDAKKRTFTLVLDMILKRICREQKRVFPENR